MKRLRTSLYYAIQGIQFCFLTQRNFRIHFLGFLFMNSTALYFHFTREEYMICLILSSAVFMAELMNTAIESVTNLAAPDPNPLAKIAKDCAAGAVLIAALCSVSVWGLIVICKLWT